MYPTDSIFKVVMEMLYLCSYFIVWLLEYFMYPIDSTCTVVMGMSYLCSYLTIWLLKKCIPLANKEISISYTSVIGNSYVIEVNE